MSSRRILSILCLLLGVLLSAPSRSLARVELGRTLEVPAAPNCPPNAYGPAQTLAILEDGSFAVGRRCEYFEVAFFAPDGTSLGAPVPIVRLKDSITYGGIGAFGNRYFVTWSNIGSGQARAAFYGREGKPLSKVFRWPYSDSIYQYSSFFYAPGPKGTVVPFFVYLSGEDQYRRPAYSDWSQVFGPNAAFIGERIYFRRPPIETFVQALGLNEDGRFAIEALRCPSNPRSRKPCDRGLQIFDGAWRPRSPFLSDGLPPGDDHSYHYALAMQRSGVIGLAWTQEFGEPRHDDRVLAEVFRRDGTPQGNILRLSGLEASYNTSSRLRATPWGSFIDVWVGIPDGFTTNVYLREFDQTGKLGPLLLVAEDEKLSGYDFQMNSSGRGVILRGHSVTLVTATPEAAAPEDNEHE